MHAFIADPSTPGYPNLARACTQPLTTGPMLAGRSTLIGWTRKIIVTLAVTHAYGLPAAALPQVPYPMEVSQTGLSGLSLSSTRPSPLRAQDEAAGRSVRQKGVDGQPLGVGPQMPGIMASSLETVAEGPPRETALTAS